MNKVYKVIWSKAKHCYVVVSEIAKRNGKGQSSGVRSSVTAPSLLCTLALLLGTTVWALPAGAVDKTTGSGNGIAYGSQSQASLQTSVAVGKEAKAIGAGTTAIGDHAKAADNAGTDPVSGGTAVGSYSEAASDHSTAIGQGATVIRESENSVALGAYSSANRKEAQITAGWLAPSSVTGDTAGIWKATRGVVAIGHISEPSVGHPNGVFHTRQIIGLAAGTADTDAVNVAQLKAAYTRYYSVNSSLQGPGSNYDNSGATGANALAAGVNAKAAKAGDVAVGYGAQTTPDAQGNNIAIGTSGKVTRGADSVAIGHGAEVNSASTGGMIALGKNAVVATSAYANAIAIGTGSTVSGDGLAIGPSASVTMSSTTDGSGIAIGNTAKVDAKEGGIAIGKNATATNTSGDQGAPIAIGMDSNVTGIQSMALGYGAKTEGNQEKVVAIGAKAKTTGSSRYAAVVGAEANASMERASALGYQASVTVQGGVALGAGSVADRTQDNADPYTVGTTAGTAQQNAINATKATDGAVSVGSSTVRRQLINVAAGTADTDAVNVAQLKAAVGSSAGGAIHDYSVKSVDTASDTNYNNGGATGANALAARLWQQEDLPLIRLPMTS